MVQPVQAAAWVDVCTNFVRHTTLQEQKPVRDGDLLGSMAKRLSCIEAELASSRAQVQQLLAENARLLAQQQVRAV
jgi:hypothetical protein